MTTFAPTILKKSSVVISFAAGLGGSALSGGANILEISTAIIRAFHRSRLM